MPLLGESCPFCKITPLVIAGAKRRIEDLPGMGEWSNVYVAEAGCIACDAYLGQLRLKVETLFGLREDGAIQRLGIRIY